MVTPSIHTPDGTLRAVLVSSVRGLLAAMPSATPASWLSMPDPVGLQHEVHALHEFLRSKAETIVLDVADGELYDGIYARDYGAVVGRELYVMRSPVSHRAGEQMRVLHGLALHGIPAVAVPADARGEGADLLPLGGGEWSVATGRRSTVALADWVEQRLPASSVLHRTHKRGPAVPQHLLGGNRLLGGVLYHRDDVEPLPGWRGPVERLAVDDEVHERLAMNWLVLARAEVLMPDDCPHVRRLLENRGVHVHALPMGNLRAMGGGFACATLPLNRGD